MSPDEKENQAKIEAINKQTENSDKKTDEKNTPPPATFKIDNLLNFALSESKKKDEKKKEEG